MKRLILSVLILVGVLIYFKNSQWSGYVDDGITKVEKTKTAAYENFPHLSPETKTADNSNDEPQIELLSPPNQKVLLNDYHIYQTFNNCGPASLSMILSYYGLNISQAALGNQLRPYQNQEGNNDDKSVTMEELSEKAKEYGFVPFHRPNGDIETIRYAITYDIPVVVKTWLAADEDTGHYRVVKGYDHDRGVIIQDDSMQGHNLEFDFDALNEIWKKYNYEYLLIVPPEKVQVVEAFLGKNADEQQSWELAVQNAKSTIQSNPDDVDARFNLVVALHNTGDYENAVLEYEKVEPLIKLKRLWYQIEPVNAYYETGNYGKVISLSNDILINGNAAYSELYLLRGKIFSDRGDNEQATAEFEKALFYNNNLQDAKEALTY